MLCLLSVLGASPEGVGEDSTTPVDMDTVELTVMDDIHSPDSPHVSRRSAKDGHNSSSSDEEETPEEDRYIYTL